MKLHQGGEVQVRQDVAVQDQERLVQVAGGIRHGPARPQRPPLGDPRDRGMAAPGSDERRERLLQVRGGQEHFADTVPGQVVEDVVQERPVDQRHQGLGDRLGQGPHARPLPAHQNDGLHVAAPPDRTTSRPAARRPVRPWPATPSRRTA